LHKAAPVFRAFGDVTSAVLVWSSEIELKIAPMDFALRQGAQAKADGLCNKRCIGLNAHTGRRAGVLASWMLTV
jgi:hypothetical protein